MCSLEFINPPYKVHFYQWHPSSLRKIFCLLNRWVRPLPCSEIAIDEKNVGSDDLPINSLVTFSDDPMNESMTCSMWDEDTRQRRLVIDSALFSILSDPIEGPTAYSMKSLARFEAGPYCRREAPVGQISSAAQPPEKPLRRGSLVPTGGCTSTGSSCSLDCSTTCWHCNENGQWPSTMHPPRKPIRQFAADNERDFRSLRPPTKPIRQRTVDENQEQESPQRVSRSCQHKLYA